MKTGIIIPCYNEESRLNSKAFLSFVESHPSYELCFVNDGSKDNTLGLLRSMERQFPFQISVVDVKRNMGKAAAVRAGARHLYNKADVTFIGFIDADLSTDFEDFKALVKTLKSDSRLNMVFGSRHSADGAIQQNGFRKLVSNQMRCIIKRILGLPIHDTQCGAKVFSRSIIPIVYKEAFLSKWLFDVEIFFRLKKYLGRKNVMRHLCEQPLQRWVHVDDSRIGFKDSVIIPLKLVHIWANYKLSALIQLICIKKLDAPSSIEVFSAEIVQ